MRTWSKSASQNTSSTHLSIEFFRRLSVIIFPFLAKRPNINVNELSQGFSKVDMSLVIISWVHSFSPEGTFSIGDFADMSRRKGFDGLCAFDVSYMEFGTILFQNFISMVSIKLFCAFFAGKLFYDAFTSGVKLGKFG